MTYHRLFRIQLVIILLLLANTTFAANQLTLAGSGTRKAFFISLYTCEIYAEQSGTKASELLNDDLEVRVKLIVHGNPPGSPPEHWASVLKDELSDKMFRITKRTYRNLEEGDRIILHYQPGKGTSVDINSQDLFTDPGRALMVSILDQWLGEEPVSENFKAELLGE